MAGTARQHENAHGIRAQANLTIFKWFTVSLDLGGTSPVANRAVAYFMVTCAAMIPAALCAVICVVAGAPMVITLPACLAAGVISRAAALLPYPQPGPPYRRSALPYRGRRHVLTKVDRKGGGRRGRKNRRKSRRGPAKKQSEKGPAKRAVYGGKARRNRRGPRR